MRSTSRRARTPLLAAALLALGLPLVALAASREGAAPGAAPSFTRDVAPIVRDKCSGCHRVGGIAPFPLETARQISSRAARRLWARIMRERFGAISPRALALRFHAQTGGSTL
ncbi:MAG TPA: methylmalonyl-CoA mutase family protein, partial [Gaiellaceae bacterium]|nr:methylmalonyl-CoA mutase family protein [Gaiellaceae bacterium]